MSQISKCKLSDLQETDLELVLRWRNSQQIRDNMFTDHIITMVEHKQWFNRIKTDPRTLVKIFSFESKPLGVVIISNIDKQNNKCYWGFYIGEQNAPKGSGTMMGLLALEYIFNKMGIRKLCSEVIAFNTASINYHQKLGFGIEGRLVQHINKHNQYFDIILMALFSEKWPEVKRGLMSKIGGIEDDGNYN